MVLLPKWEIKSKSPCDHGSERGIKKSCYEKWLEVIAMSTLEKTKWRPYYSLERVSI